MEQATGIEPAQSAWEAEVLPLNYACLFCCKNIIYHSSWFVNTNRTTFFEFSAESPFCTSRLFTTDNLIQYNDMGIKIPPPCLKVLIRVKTNDVKIKSMESEFS